MLMKQPVEYITYDIPVDECLISHPPSDEPEEFKECMRLARASEMRAECPWLDREQQTIVQEVMQDGQS